MKPTKHLLALAAMLCMALGINAQTTYYWIGTGNWATASNWSTARGGSPASVAPTTADVAVFYSGGGNCTLAANASIGEVVMEDDYAHTLDLDGHSLTVAGNFTQHAGTFQGRSAAVAIGGLLHIIGGSYHATTATTSVAGGIVEEGAYLQPHGGTITITGTAAVIDVTSFLYNLQIATGASAWLANSIQVANNLHLNGPLNADVNAIVLGNPAPTALTGSSGAYFNIDGGAIGLFIWLVGEATGTYTLPLLATPTGPVVPATVHIATAGAGAEGRLLFTTIELDASKPQDLLGDGTGYYNATGGNNAPMNINRIWLTVLGDYTASPVFNLQLAYTTADLSGISATEANLKAQIFDEKHWGELLGTLDAGANLMAISGLTLPTDERASFITLVDNTSRNRSTYAGKTGLTCSDAINLEEAGMEEAVFRQQEFELWFKFNSADLFYDIFINAEDPYFTLLVDSVEIFSDSCDTLSKVSTIYKQDLESSLFGRAILTSTGDYFMRTRKSGLSITDFSLLLPRSQQFVFVMSDSTIVNGAYTPATTNYDDNVSFCQDSIWLSRGGGSYPDSAYYYQFALQRWDILLGTWTFYDTINVIPSVNLAKVFLPSGYYKASVNLKSYSGWVPSFLANVPVTFRIKTVDGALFLDKDPREVCIGEEVNFFCLNGQGGVPGSASPSANFDYFWNFGDGTSNHDAASVWHTYYMRGLYTVTVEEKATCRVLDYNISNSPFEVVRYFRDSIDIEVEGAEFSYDYICQQQIGDTSAVDIILYDDANCTSNYDIVWDLHGYSYNTSQTLTGDSASFQIRQPAGQYPVTMYLYDGANLIDSATQYINIIGKPEIIGQTMVCDSYHNYSVSNPTYGDYYTWYVYNGGTLVYVDSNTTTLEYVGSSFTSVVVSIEVGSCIYWDTLATTDPCCYTSGSSVVSTSIDSISLFDQIYFSNIGTITTNIDIVFNGTIYINKDFILLDCPNIYFAPNAKMIVMPGKTLTIENSKLQAGCDTMWDGIYVSRTVDSLGKIFVIDSSIISDAKNALVSTGGGSITVQGSTLKNNYKHIVARDYDNVVSLTLDTAILTMDDELLPPYAGRDQAVIGIEIDSIWQTNIGNSGSGLNFIAGADTAITVRNSQNVFIDNNLVGNLFAYGFDIANGEVGVYAQNVRNLKIGTNEPNVFIAQHEGIKIVACNNPKITGNGFLGVTGTDGIVTQFLLPSGAAGSDSSLIEYNSFAGKFKRGIYNSDNFGKLMIANNTFAWDSASSATAGTVGILHMNIWMLFFEQFGDTTYAGKAAMWNNEIGGYGNGIVLVNATGSRVQGNNITVKHGSSTTSLAGIAYWNSPKANIYCNDIASNTKSEYSTVGTWGATSPSSWIQCNVTDSVGRGMLFDGSNFFSLVNANTMRDNAVGLSLANNGRVGFIGFNDGIIDYTFDNRWQGGFTAHTRTYGLSDGRLSPIRLRNNGSNDFLPIGIVNDDNGVPPGLAAITTNSVVPDNDSLTCTVCDVQTIVFNKRQALSVVADTIVYPNDSLIYRWWDRYGLYHALTANPDVLEEEEDLEDFFEDYSNSFIVELDGIKKDIRQAEVTVGFSEVNINGFQNRLNALSPSNDIETNALDYSWIYFGLARGTQTYVDVETDVIALSEKCVFYGGPAVWEARSLRMKYDFGRFDTDWEDSCTVPSSKWDGSRREDEATKTTVELSYKLVPNFYAGQRTGSVTLGEKEVGELRIYGIDGKLLHSFILQSGLNTLDLTYIGKTTGMYLYKIFVNGTVEHTDKLVIIE